MSGPAAGLPEPLGARFEAIRSLGGGASAEVVAAHDRELRRRVALKLWKVRPGPEALARFQREARVAGQLRHPHVAAVYDAGLDARGYPFIVYEYVEGQSLERLLASGTPPGPAAVARWGRELAGALATAHGMGVVHRDVKPANVLVRPRQGAVLVDFGLAQEQGGERLTATNVSVGTPIFMAPEVLRGEDAGPAADQFSLAATLYRALLGSDPRYPGGSGSLLEARVRGLRPEAPPGLEPGPARMAGALLRALRPSPQDRYPDLGALAAALGEGGEGPAPLPSPPRLGSPAAGVQLPPAPARAARRRGPALAMALAVAGAALLAVRGGLRPPRPAPDPPPSDPARPVEGAAPPPDPARSLEAASRALAGSHPLDVRGGPTMPAALDMVRHAEALIPELLDPRLPLRLRRYLECGTEAARAGAFDPGRPGRVLFSFQLAVHVFDDLSALTRTFQQQTLGRGLRDLVGDRDFAARVDSLARIRQEADAVGKAWVAALDPALADACWPVAAMKAVLESRLDLPSATESLDRFDRELGRDLPPDALEVRVEAYVYLLLGHGNFQLLPCDRRLGLVRDLDRRLAARPSPAFHRVRAIWAVHGLDFLMAHSPSCGGESAPGLQAVGRELLGLLESDLAAGPELQPYETPMLGSLASFFRQQAAENPTPWRKLADRLAAVADAYARAAPAPPAPAPAPTPPPAR